MTKQQKLDAIYEAMADKTLSYGCLCWLDDDFLYRLYWNEQISSSQDSQVLYRYSDDKHYRVTTIIWHPVRIGDVLDWFDKSLEIFLDVNNDEWHDIYKDIISLWWNKRLSIDYQSMKCVDLVYSLIKK